MPSHLRKWLSVSYTLAAISTRWAYLRARLAGPTQPHDRQASAGETPDASVHYDVPRKWNNRSPSAQATTLLRQAIRRGQIGHPLTDGLPEYVWARDPEDTSIIYQARRLRQPAEGYKAYPLIEPEIDALRVEIR
jgi:hypothetical protein